MAEPSLDVAEARRARGTSACPGLFRIVPARDGGICRVKLALGRLPASAARAVTTAAARYGSGVIEVTNRANLQLRGVAADAERPLIEALLAAGLGPPDPEGDDSRNLMVSPTAGIDPQMAMDVLPLARALLAHLGRDPACRRLSPKFAILIDGGESLAVLDHPHDLWLAAMEDGERMALGIAGPLGVAPFAALRREDALATLAAALDLFAAAAARDGAVTRARHLPSLGAELAERLGGRLERGPAVAGWRRPTPPAIAHIGIGRQREAGLVFVGAQPPLGRLSPGLLARLAALAEAEGNGSLHFTPWQSVLLPAVAAARGDALVQALAGLGLVTDPTHPLAATVACAGTPGCAAAQADAKADALQLAAALPAGRSLHVSGCAKGCASPRRADLTLIATAPGRYDLVCEGAPAVRGLTLAAAARRLRAAEGS